MQKLEPVNDLPEEVHPVANGKRTVAREVVEKLPVLRVLEGDVEMLGALAGLAEAEQVGVVEQTHQ
jgi:hypothetical protein